LCDFDLPKAWPFAEALLSDVSNNAQTRGFRHDGSILNLHNHRYTYSIFSFFQVPQVSDAVVDVIYKCFLPVAAGEVKD
jgi:hypothetical protein